MFRKHKKIFSIILAITLILSLVTGCNAGKSVSSSTKETKTSSNANSQSPFKITIMTMSFFPDPVPMDSPVIQEMEKYTNTKVEINWVPNSAYDNKLNTVLASGNLPMIILADAITPSIVSAAKAGAFWEIGPYLKDYPNLSKANPTILWNTSIDGKIYGIYRGRDLGRNGIGIRKDWMDNLGLQEPKTIDDLYNVLKAFTYDDPDKDGKKDTYGMIWDKNAAGSGYIFDMILTWFGAPNGWGDDGTGKLVPTFYTKEYMNGLQFLRKIYKEGLVNPDFATVDPTKDTGLYENGKAGVSVNVLDATHRIQEACDKDGIKANWDVIPSVAGPDGQMRTLATSGYSGIYMIPKQSVKTVSDLKKVLSFLDKLGDKKMQDLLGWGIEGRHYELKDGTINPYTNMSPAVAREVNDTNQLLMFIPPENATPRYATPLRAKETQLIQQNAKIAVSNPAAPFVSQSAVYAQLGPQLDNIIHDAEVKYVTGQIDDKGFQDAINLWRKTGGEQLIQQVNELYNKYKTEKANIESLTK